MTERSFDRSAAAVAALLLIFAGFVLWHSDRAETTSRVRQQRVAWRCANHDGGTCVAVSEIERCTTCHDVASHPHRDVLVARHAGMGCVACHGGDGLATDRDAAHSTLARLGKGGDVPEIQARCAACHEDTRSHAESPAKAAWARWIAARDHATAPPAPVAPSETGELAPALARGRALFRSMRCGACHAARDASPVATPLDVLGLRSSPDELAAALRGHAAVAAVDLGLDEPGAVAVATHLASLASPDASTAMVHRASVPGSSAEEGKTLYEKLACAACHEAKASAKDDGRLHVDLSHVAATRTADWVAYFLVDPSRANPASAMPSLRLTAREASSLAAHLVPHRPAAPAPPASRSESIACKVPDGATKPMAREACGAAIVAAAKCATCHTTKLAPSAPSLERFGDAHDGTNAEAAIVDHAGYRLDGTTKRALATYLLAQRSVRVRPDLRAPAHPGETAFRALGCAGCHAQDDVAATAPGPSLFGEGLRVQPQWLFAFLNAPERHPVRPRFHPEWAFRDLVPPDRVATRMPTYALGARETTALVDLFSERDGAELPYADVPRVALAGDALTTAVTDLVREDRGDCTSCHTVGAPDAARAREDGPKLAPPLALAHERLRPAWVEACIVQPDVWVKGMPAFAKPLPEVDRLRDLVFLLRERTVLPAAGHEGSTPALGLGDLGP